MRTFYSLLSLLVVETCLGSDPIMPNPLYAPGVITNVPIDILCKPNYTKIVRNVSAKTADEVYARDGIKRVAGRYEVDHLISLVLGGTNDKSNLWVQSYVTVPWNAHRKDVLENWMHHSVVHWLAVDKTLAEEVLKRYQYEISHNWTNAYLKYIGKP